MTDRIDIGVTTDLGGALNARGDVMTTDATQTEHPLVQRAMLRIMNVSVSWYGEPVTRERALSYRAAVERTLRDDPVIDVPVNVTVSDIEADTLTVAVQLSEIAFQFTGPLSELGETP